jgi:hypothetical protein
MVLLLRVLKYCLSSASPANVHGQPIAKIIDMHRKKATKYLISMGAGFPGHRLVVGMKRRDVGSERFQRKCNAMANRMIKGVNVCTTTIS